MKKTLMITGIASIAVLTGIAALVATPDAQAANTQGNTNKTTMQTQNKTQANRPAQRGGEQRKGFGREEGKGQREGDFGGGSMMMGMGKGLNQNSDIAKALAANDYNAFVTARNADTHKPSDATVPTQEEFTKMVTRHTKQEAAQKALESNNYEAYVAATTISQEEFTTRVARFTAHKNIQSAVEANDYNAFVTARNADSHKPSGATVPTQEEFTKMVEQHQERTQ